MAAKLQGIAWVFEASLDVVFVADTSGRVLYLNPRAQQLWASGAETTVEQLLPSDLLATSRAGLVRVLEARESFQFEWGEQGKAGALRWFSCTLSPLLDGDAPFGYLSVSTDVTRLKRSEERLRRSEQLMVDTQGVAHLGTWEWDISEPTAVWSEELYRIYGLTPETYTPSYDRYLEMVHPDDRARVIDATNRVFHEHVPYSHDERIFRPDGSMRYLHTWAHPVLDDAGKLVRLVGVCQDITEQTLAKQQVIELNADLERRVLERTRTIEASIADLEAFNAMASHDLRAPLAVIQGSCELLQRQGTELPAPVARNLERIQRSSKHMTTLVNDLMSLAQVGHAALCRTRVDLVPICQELIEQLRRSEPTRQVALEVPSRLLCTGDPGLLRVALGNLVGNAWKYSAKVEQAHIEVGELAGVARPTFFVRDNGAGFDMKEVARLFVPFQRLHRSSDFAGTGIGLAGTQRIIERHGGRIWAEGEVNVGATFFFELPTTSAAPGS